MRLSIVLPTYNERGNIAALVARIEGALPAVPHEIVFVDDSTDGTDAVIAECARRRGSVVLIHRRGKRGLASAVVEGIARARGDLVCVLDADLQHPPEVVPLLLEALDRTGADLVVASRNVPGGGYEAFSFARRAVSRVATMLAKTLLTRARLVSDPMSGFFAMRREVVRHATLRPVGYKVLLEVLARGRLARVVEVPYRFRARGAGQSKLTFRQHWEYLIHLVRLTAAQPDDLRFMRFCLVGASGTAVNMGVIWALAAHGLHYLAAGVAAAAAGTTWNFLLNDAFTWRDRRAPSLGAKAGRYLRYWAVTGPSSAVQVGLLLLLTSGGLPYWAANLIGIGASTVWNFCVHGRWTWKPSQPAVTRALYRPPLMSVLRGASAVGTAGPLGR